MRADVYLAENKYFLTRTKAKQAIERGEVIIDGKKVDKSSTDISSDINHTVEIIVETFVSLGGYKLEKAVKEFGLDFTDLKVADIGASTGGFTDCALKYGAKTVYSVDLNDKLLSDKLKNDRRVKTIIKNAKNLTAKDFDGAPDFIVADLSFISVTSVLPTLSSLLTSNGRAVILIKPQFEMDLKRHFKNGIIRDKKLQNKAVEKVIICAKKNSFNVENITTAPENKDKNLEFLLLLTKI